MKATDLKVEGQRREREEGQMGNTQRAAVERGLIRRQEAISFFYGVERRFGKLNEKTCPKRGKPKASRRFEMEGCL